MLPLVGLAYNSLGYDGSGLAMLLAAPIRFRDVLVAKNLLHTIVVVAEILTVSVLGWFVVGPTPPLVVGLTLAGALVFLLTNLAAGNLVSLYFPRKLNPGQMRRQRASGHCGRGQRGNPSAAGSTDWRACTSSRAGRDMSPGAGSPSWRWRAPPGWLYRHVLDLVSDIAWKRREVMMTELSRPE